MKYLFLLISLVCFCATSQAQIEVQNYRMQEQINWNNSIRIDQRQMNQIKAGISNNNETVMDISILMNVEATSYSAMFNVRQVAETATEVNELLNGRLEQFKKSLEALGVKKNEMVVELISQVPIYGLKTNRKLFSKSMQEIPIGFELHKNITVTYSDYDLLNNIVYEASKAEIYDLIKVDYFAANPFAYYDTMRHAASQYLKAVEYKFKEAGFRIDTFDRILAEKTSVVYPISRYTTYRGLSKLSYGKLLAKAGGTEMPTLKAAPSMYYNPLPFNNFDVVIRPRISKPSIQYTLNLKAKFVNVPKPVKQPDPPKVEKQFFFITPEGEVKLLDVVKKNG
ncbi:MAG: SIMPL domain-containing protein [Bacteroidia bacterium]|nr:SIMPL domain-containing protein [Bacteroidia bacterium]